MAQNFDSIRRGGMEDTFALDHSIKRSTTYTTAARDAMDTLFVEAEASQRELAKRIPGMMAVEQTTVNFDWDSVTGVDHEPFARYCHTNNVWF